MDTSKQMKDSYDIGHKPFHQKRKEKKKNIEVWHINFVAVILFILLFSRLVLFLLPDVAFALVLLLLFSSMNFSLLHFLSYCFDYACHEPRVFKKQPKAA